MKKLRARDTVEAFVSARGLVRARDVEAAGFDRGHLRDLLRDGRLERDARGLYRAADCGMAIEHSLAIVARKQPSAVICLLSALQFHEIGTECPVHLWIAVPPRARAPKVEGFDLRVMRPSDATRELDVETHVISGVPVRVTSKAKTVVDCFAYRNKVGIDVAVEALRDVLGPPHRVRIAELGSLAAKCRMSRVMWPYLAAVQ